MLLRGSSDSCLGYSLPEKLFGVLRFSWEWTSCIASLLIIYLILGFDMAVWKHYNNSTTFFYGGGFVGSAQSHSAGSMKYPLINRLMMASDLTWSCERTRGGSLGPGRSEVPRFQRGSAGLGGVKSVI
ncbi:hypothetical protein GE21DRAFT_1132375 [Neurospora crassa]|nr:hypothetical protein GE21DRAFT_1132375 [Neurospora crassa]